MGGAIDPRYPGRPACRGRTCFDSMIEGWPDQASVRHLLDALHQRELDRIARHRHLDRITSESSWRVDPGRGIVSVTINGSPVSVYPGIRESAEADTMVIPRVLP